MGHHLNVILLMSYVIWVHIKAVGRGTIVCQKVQIVLLSAIILLHLNVILLTLYVIWVHTKAVGRGTIVCQKVQFVLLSAIIPHHLNVILLMSYVIWVHTKAVGRGTIVCQGSVCPPVCHHPAPSNCLDNEIRCDSGTDQGCWIGDYCMPKGSVCPDLFV